ncbi:MAG: arginine--tRNA ligase, partial [Bacteroidales bacterium]|nr:arginine--tRNA ligase [Bacteroidales bacterium]
MQRIDQTIRLLAVEAIKEIWSTSVQENLIQVQKTRKEFEGDFTIVVFPLLRLSRLSPEKTGNAIGSFLVEHSEMLSGYNVIKGFLNMVVSQQYWKALLDGDLRSPRYGFTAVGEGSPKVMIEFSSPNTNKPLHLGHIRNNLLGHSVSTILEASGRQVRKVNLVNDRGIHICKSMLAWQEFGNGETPESSGMKGDHLVGKYYVRYDQAFKEEVKAMVKRGKTQQEAEAGAPVLEQAREMLRNWEAEDPEVRELWERMNSWVYAGFEETYRRLGVSFDQTYHESKTYKLGRELVLKGLENGVLYRKKDGSVWADLTEDGLDHKLLLRSDGTSVYMTQDVGTAHQRYGEFEFDSHIYVVGNEQNYHFQVLVIVLKKLGYAWADKLYHLNYGMVELPEGKMKSREGTVVDADNLMDEMEATARQMSEELGKLGEYGEEEKNRIYRQVGMGALKYFILKVDPKKNMTFDPAESVDFNGNTGPFIQYTYARIKSVIRKGESIEKVTGAGKMNEKEIGLVRMMYEYPDILKEASRTLNPSLVANFLYELAKEFNQFYHDHSILSADSSDQVSLRLLLVEAIGRIIENGMELLGIEVPER